MLHPIEPLRQEVRAAVFLQQRARHHADPARHRHQVVCVLDAAIALRIAQRRVRHAIELDQTVGETLQPIDLPAAHLAGVCVVRHDRLRPRTTGARAHLDDVQQRFLLALLATRLERFLLRHHVARHTHQLIDLQGLAARLQFTVTGLELQRAHAAMPQVAQLLHGIRRPRIALLPAQPRVQQRIAETVRQAIGQQARQPFEGLIAQIAEAEHLLAAARLRQRHHHRRHIQPAARERAVELERGPVQLVVPHHQADRLAPQQHFRVGYHVLFGLGGATSGCLRPARLRCFFRYFSCASTSM